VLTVEGCKQVTSRDDRYLTIIRDALHVCLDYKPKFGRRKKDGYSIEEFQALYEADPFYNWFGLDSPLLYVAHKAAGGITSVYRQIGIACERVFRRILQDALGLTDEQSKWKYTVPTARGEERTLSLDARIPLADISTPSKADGVRKWFEQASVFVKLTQDVSKELHGAVFEVRQGYKSKDSKRQNADISNAANAYAHHYLPVLLLFSLQIDEDIADRYVRSQWLLLKGSLTGNAMNSTYVFCREVLGYDLAGFFERTSPIIRREVDQMIQRLLE